MIKCPHCGRYPNDEGKKPRRTRRTLPPDFIPDIELPRSLNWAENKINQEIQRFFDYAKAHNKLYADWDAAWRNWCRSPLQRVSNGTDRENGRSEFKQALHELGEYAAGGSRGS